MEPAGIIDKNCIHLHVFLKDTLFINTKLINTTRLTGRMELVINLLDLSHVHEMSCDMSLITCFSLPSALNQLSLQKCYDAPPTTTEKVTVNVLSRQHPKTIKRIPAAVLWPRLLAHE